MSIETWWTEGSLEQKIEHIKNFVLKTTMSVADPYQRFYNMHLFTSVDEIRELFSSEIITDKKIHP